MGVTMGTGSGKRGRSGGRRLWTAHRGVKLVARTLASGSVAHEARWKDPATGKTVSVSLDRLRLSTPEQRNAWAVEKARQLAADRAGEVLGEMAPAATKVEESIRSFLDGARLTLRPGTVAVYAASLALFRTWCELERVRRLSDLTGPKLARFRGHLLAMPRRVPAKKGGRGERRADPTPRGARTTSKDLRQVVVFLRDATRRGLVPRLTRDAISDALRPVKAERKLPRFLSASECRALLEAAEKHDREMYEETRAEHRGTLPRGCTPRYPAIAPAVRFALLSGCRRGEIASLRWEDVDLTVTDEFGRAVGELRVRAAVSKTRSERRIDLSVSPLLRSVVAELEAKRGDRETVFGLTDAQLEAGMKRLRKRYGAPPVSWHDLRRTCATYLTNAAGIWGSASIFKTARQLGHSVAVSEQVYTGLVAISRDARTLEAAMRL